MFDEIVLVEPGENGSVFGDQNFWDYVIVEGSTDSGVTWKRFVDGYDARANAPWLSKWNSSKDVDGNSTAVGDPGLFKTRLIKMTGNGNFKTNDEVQIRFRLFADQASHGWGWAIDNLSIQGPITGIEKSLFENSFSIYPNPTNGSMVTVKFNTLDDMPVQLQFVSAQGAVHQNVVVQPVAKSVEKEFLVGDLPGGLYIIKAEVGGSIITKKFIKLN